MGCFDNKIIFTKMHGAGNDYIYIDGRHTLPANLPLLARQISDRHFGVGGDGLVVLMDSEVADYRMRMFNADGSEAGMCGNAARCILKFLHTRYISHATSITLETGSGVRRVSFVDPDYKTEDFQKTPVTVDMGEPHIRPDEIPIDAEGDGPVAGKRIDLDGTTVEIAAVGMGNPHGVVFTADLSDRMVLEIGPRLESASVWPEKANIEFAQVIDRTHIKMRVWERGTGETLACGTGACAVVVAAVIQNLTGRSVEVEVKGGRLKIDWDEKSGHVLLTGPAVVVADGFYYPYDAITEGMV